MRSYHYGCAANLHVPIGSTGYHVFRSVTSFFLTLPYEIVVAPYRFLRLLTKPHSMSATEWTP